MPATDFVFTFSTYLEDFISKSFTFWLPNDTFIKIKTASTTHHYMRWGAFYQAVCKQPFGTTEDTVKDPGIGHLLLLLLVHDSSHE